MKKIISSLLLLTMLLGACSPAIASPETQVTLLSEATAAGNSDQVETSREAVLSEIENDVTAKAESASEFSSASVGLIISVGDTLQTGNDSRAKLNLTPENTIVRVGPNSSFMLSKIENENGEPKTTLQLFFGKVFILLNGGSLDVETPSGVASVRGSLLSVQYSSEANRMRASCLEGECALENEAGTEVEFGEGESVFIDEEGAISEISEIDQDEIEAWLNENPELDEFMEDLPEPEEFPDFDDNEWYQEDGEPSTEEDETESTDVEENSDTEEETDE
jgi:hypothetical protein